ncbi:TetR/AcrR family transcriptional regulator [Streptomyces sp. NBC_00038]|uniref:TetR/AcrR family transcriptional regulator n=1 Tax=Streptomyces sp. NBC_00038 TaxID=2903615 RepID=UPI002255E643|nr:TetR/AcrR family transcriptional regulator [Streptomyces sp. NBC_00038]MCX5554568.1 TetR/AcrR family transcriptional regulator [Streptomyces sp. NBC_00038]
MTVSSPALTAAPPAAAVAPRERLLDAAALLFYQEGVHAGVEALCRAAGVSKRSMYQLFTSKDEVLAASLERAALTYWEALSPRNDDRAPRARILHVFEQLEALSGSPTYRGCPLVATAVELKDPEHPASAVARRFKDGLTNYFHEEALRAGAPDPNQLASQLTVVFDGSSVSAVVQAQPLRGLAVTTATTLLDAAGLR